MKYRPALPAVLAWSVGSAWQAGARCCTGFADVRQGWEGRQARAAESLAGEQGASGASDRCAEISPGALGQGLGSSQRWQQGLAPVALDLGWLFDLPTPRPASPAL